MTNSAEKAQDSELSESACISQLSIRKDWIKVAFSSMDGESVDQHFGSARGFYVYGVTEKEVSLIASKSFPKEKKDGNEDKLKPKLSWLLGCDIVYCGSIGGSASRQLISMGVHPKVVKEGPDVDDLIIELQGELAGEISPMLQRILKSKQPKNEERFSEMDGAWDE